MNDTALNRMYEYAVRIRRQLHEYPEVGFDLPRTVALVEAELDAMGIAHTGRYGTCSVVADLGQGERCIALRADMDALPVEEKADVPFRSKIPGKMHACGHDAHTAVLLAVAGYLKAHESELKHRVRLIFQPSEEGAISGAKMMVDNGVMDGVDCILGSHSNNAFEVGKIACRAGDFQAACIPSRITFLGKTSHATVPENGVDAIGMAFEAYGALKAMVAREAGKRNYIWSVGRFEGGHVHNVIADRCEMDISFRFYDMEFARRVEAQTKDICRAIARSYGGEVEFDWNMSTGPVCNDPAMIEAFVGLLTKEGIPTVDIARKLSSEDFGWYLTKSPGVMFNYGTGNVALGCTAAGHENDFRIDENGMRNAMAAFVAWAMKAD